MEIDDKTLINLYKISPDMVPLLKVKDCLKLLTGDDREKLIRSLTRRAPRTESERRTLLYYASTHGIGGLLFIDALGGFKNQRPC